MKKVLHSLYVKVPAVGELHVDFRSPCRGRRAIDYASDGKCLEIFIGCVHIEAEPDRRLAVVLTFIGGWLLEPPQVLISHAFTLGN